MRRILALGIKIAMEPASPRFCKAAVLMVPLPVATTFPFCSKKFTVTAAGEVDKAARRMKRRRKAES